MITLAPHFKKPLYLLILLPAIVLSACSSSNKQKDQPVQPSFKPVWGKGFTEVRRNFNNGISFSDYGYQLEPEWRLTFVSDDSVNIYNPRAKTWGNAPILFDHDSIFNIAWAYLRLRKFTRDSIIFQVMKVEDRVLTREKSIVYMTLYANDYIQKTLHTDAKSLIHPNRRDTLYIKEKVLKANADTANAFAARQQAILKCKSNLLTIEQQDPTFDNKTASAISNDYLLPEYNVSIKNAYEDFSYSFSVLIDGKGKILFVRSRNFIFPEFRASYNKTMRAIVDGYLSAYLDITAGSTLGMPHSSIVILHVSGTKKK